VIHTMPDKTVRVTSRYPKRRGTVYFDLTKAHGFTLEADRYDPETLVLQAVGCYSDSACCRDLESGRSSPNPVCGQAVRT